MTSAYILILAVLFLGGLLAVVGDRVGTKVGRARLRLFNLRPKKTATLVAILTGTFISASTLGLLFALSEALRDGVFRLDGIQRQLRIAKEELGAISTEKEQIDQEFNQVSREKLSVEQDFKQVQSRYRSMTLQAGRLRREVEALRQQRQRLLRQIPELQAQVRQRDEQIASQDSQLRQSEFQVKSLQGREQQLRFEVSKRNQSLEVQEVELVALAQALSLLQSEIDDLREIQRRLERGEFAIIQGQVLSRGAFIAGNTEAARSAIDTLLQAANQRAILLTHPAYTGNFMEEVVAISQAEVKRLITQIQEGQQYVVRIRSAGNYVANSHSDIITGETVRVFADVTLNEQVFAQGDVLAEISFDSPQRPSNAELRERLRNLIAVAQFQARRAVVGEVLIGDGGVEDFVTFLKALGRLDSPFDQIQAIALDDTQTAGPLRLQFVVFYQGTVVLRS
ncbi:MAG: DUF3084 domain-containing protein [Cyanobacteria bacterium P01_G01_bin.54]